MKDLPRELSKMIVIPGIMPLGVCRGHLDLDNRGVRPEEYNEEVRKVLNMFGSNKHMELWPSSRVATPCASMRRSSATVDFPCRPPVRFSSASRQCAYHSSGAWSGV